MIIRNTKLLLFLALLTAGIAFFFMGYTTQRHHSLIATNYANVQTNAFEFYDMINHPDFKHILKAVDQGLEKPLTAYFSTEELKNLKIPSKWWEITPKALLQKEGYKDFKIFDKTARENAISRYSLINNTAHLDGDTLIQVGNLHFSLWDQHFNQRLNAKTVQQRNQAPLPHFEKAKMGLKLFDLTLIRILEEKQLLQIATTLQKRFYANAMGNVEAKAEQLLKFYQQSDIICMEESSPTIVRFMKNKYDTIGQPGASVIFLKKGVWKKVQQLDLVIEGFPSEEILLLVVENEKTRKKILLGAFHSDGQGKYSIAILQALKNCLAQYPEFKNLPILIAFDANTSVVTKKTKSDLEAFWRVAQKNGFSHAFPKNQPTTHKVRSFMQVQLDKGNAIAEDKEDWVLYRKVKIRKTKNTSPGPNEDNPTDHAILYIRFKF